VCVCVCVCVFQSNYLNTHARALSLSITDGRRLRAWLRRSVF
jgi:hypothetical protein